jgi:WD40 repeat protein
MTAAPPIFSLAIQSTTVDGEYRVVAEWTRPGEPAIRRELELRLPTDELDAAASPLAYGTTLGQQVFAGTVRELFAQARADASELRVLLSVEAKALQPLRWERLAGPFDDDQWGLFSQSQRTPFSLYLPSTCDRRFLPFGRRELRALVVVASPEPDNRYRVEPFDEAQAIDTALAGLGEIPSRVLGTDPRAEGPPTVTEICKQLTAERFTLLHLVCHGMFSTRTGETAVFLRGDDGATEAVKATALLERLRELGTTHGLPHLAFLGVCESAKPEAEAALGGLGQRLVRELGMPAVVAMTERVSQQTAFALGRALYGRLRDHGMVDRALVEACVEVRRRDDVVVPALFSRVAGRPLFSDDLDRPLGRAELVAAVQEVARLFRERAPAALGRARTLAKVVAVDPSVLAGRAKLEHQASLAELEQLCEDVLELSFTALGHGRRPPPYDVRCPFPGLEAFTAEQREFFRGRDALVEALVAQLRRDGFLAVLGSSGCGKSSLVLAGVVPRLRDDHPELGSATIRPGAEPLLALERALEELESAAAWVLYVDQFEEAFTLCRDAPQRKAFFDRLLAAVGPARRVILSMRSDFIGECAEHRGLRARVEGLRLIPPLTADELRDAVEEQGAAAGLRYETGLCELILEDLANEPGAMPLLQHVLRQLYERRHGRWLRVETYKALGRVQGAITKTAERVWDELDDEGRTLLTSVMLTLTEIRESGGGEVRCLRRRVPLELLYATRAGSRTLTVDRSAVQRLVERLTAERLVVKRHDEQLGHVVEVAHEALLRRWERLQAWVVEAREVLHLRQDLETATIEWRQHELSPAYLVHVHERGELVRRFLRDGTLALDPRLEEYFLACEEEERRQLADKERQQQEKLEAAERLAREQTKRVRLLRRATTAVGAAGILAVGAAIYATLLYRQAERAEAAERRAAEEARAAESAAHEAAEQARAQEAKAQDALARQEGVSAELMADEPGERAESIVAALRIAKEHPRQVDALRLEVRRALYAATRGLHPAVQLRGHAQTITALAFSPNGTRLVTASRDDTAMVWEVETGAPQRILGQPSPDAGNRGGDLDFVGVGADGRAIITRSAAAGALRWSGDGGTEPLLEADERAQAMSLTPNGERLATAVDGVVDLWTFRDGGWNDRTQAYESSEGAITRLQLSPDGSRLLVVAAERARLIDVASPSRGTGTGILELEGHREGLEAAFSADGTRVATVDPSGMIRVWSTAGAEPPRVLQGTGEVRAIAIDPRADQIAVALDQVVEVWSLATGEKRSTLRGHLSIVSDLAFSPDGAVLATVAWDRTLRLWDARTFTERAILEGHADQIRHVAFSPDGEWIATGAIDGEARLWSAHSTTQRTLLAGGDDTFKAIALAPNGTWVARAKPGAASIQITGLSTGPSTGPRSGESSEIDVDGVTALAIAPDSQRLVTAGADRVPMVWRHGPDGVEFVGELPAHAALVLAIAFSANAERMATADASGAVKLWNAATLAPMGELMAHERGTSIVALSGDGRRLMTLGDLGAKQVKLWDFAQLDQPLASHRVDELVFAAAYPPTGDRLVIGDYMGRVQLWSHETDAVTVLPGHLANVNAIAISPDGTRMVTSGLDAKVELWDLRTGESLTSLGRHARDVRTLVFVDDGRAVLSASIDGTVQRWVVDLQARVELACEALQGVAVDEAAAAVCEAVRSGG